MRLCILSFIITLHFLDTIDTIDIVEGLSNNSVINGKGGGVIPKSYRNPCPRRQLLCYLGHIGGNRSSSTATNDNPVKVFVRYKSDENNDQSTWQEVGKIATAATEDDEISNDRNEMIIRAAQYQQRLIIEHWRRLYDISNKGKEKDKLIELGLSLPGGSRTTVEAIKWALPDDSLTAVDMIQCGFAGNDYNDDNNIVTPSIIGSESPKKKKKRTIYTDFWTNEGAKKYDRDSVRDEINKIITGTKQGQTENSDLVVSSTLKGGENDNDIVILAWKNCGYARKARKLLEERNMSYTDVVIPKFSPIHAELTFMTRRTTVPYIYVGGEFVGGCNPEGEQLIGLVGILDA